MLQMPAGGEQRAGGNGVAQPRLLATRVGGGRAEQGDVAGRHPVGDAAEALVVVGTEHGAAGDRHAHAGIQLAGRQRCLPKRGSGQVAQAQAGELSIHVGDVPALPSSTPHIGWF